MSYSYTIYLTGSSPTIVNNSINGGTCTNNFDRGMVYVIFLTGSSEPVIVNNIIYTEDNSLLDESYLIRENAATANPAEVSNNCFFHTDYLYGDFDSIDPFLNNVIVVDIDDFDVDLLDGTWTLDDFNNIGDKDAADYAVFVNIGGGDWHLQAGSPVSVREGGKTIPTVTTDRDGNPRTVPYSMGAYELD